MSLEIRVERGIDHLDDVYPGWEQEIDLDLLDMNRSNSCIIGQLFGNFYTYFKKVDHYIDWRCAEYLGFYSFLAYEELGDIWKKKIKERLNEKV